MLAGLLSGCGLRNAENLYTLPQASEEYQSLELCLQQLQDQGLEYAAPLSGSNTQPVQLQDLDGDGVEEALAFLRDTSGGEAPLKIYIFRQNEDSQYSAVATISGMGAAINSFALCQLNASETTSDLVVSWQVSSMVYSLSAYSLEQDTVTELMAPVTYTRYAVADLDADDADELILLHLDNSDENPSRAECYQLDPSAMTMTMTSTASLSAGLVSVERIQTGFLSSGETALYVTGYTRDPDAGDITNSQVLTDILAIRDQSLTNVALNPTTRPRADNLRENLAPVLDVNQDGVLEVPTTFSLSSYPPGSRDDFYGVRWYQYSLLRGRQSVAVTYYDSTDGWYLTLPDSWPSRLALAREDVNQGTTAERGVVFYLRQEDDSYQRLLTIYKDTGSDRVKRASQDGRILLMSTPDAEYSALFSATVSDPDLTEETLAQYFHLIETGWSNN